MRAKRRLYFLRHGLADRAAWSGDDDDLRPLTPEGERRLAISARTLDRLNLGVDLILTSPLTRARQTAEIAAAGIGAAGNVRIDEGLSHGFGIDDVTRLLRTHEDRERLMLVGHEPSFSQVIGRLCDRAAVVCKKGSLARVDLYDLAEPPRGQLVWLLQPKVLVRLAD